MAGATDSAWTRVPTNRGVQLTPLGPATGASSSTNAGGGLSTCVTLRARGRPTCWGTAFPLLAALFPRVAGRGGGTTGSARRRGAGTCSGCHFRIGKTRGKEKHTIHDHIPAHLLVAHAPATH